MKDKKKLIINFLSKKGRSSTAKIASAIKSNQWLADKYLETLLKDGKIAREVETNAVYWNLK